MTTLAVNLADMTPYLGPVLSGVATIVCLAVGLFVRQTERRVGEIVDRELREFEKRWQEPVRNFREELDRLKNDIDGDAGRLRRVLSELHDEGGKLDQRLRDTATGTATSDSVKLLGKLEDVRSELAASIETTAERIERVKGEFGGVHEHLEKLEKLTDRIETVTTEMPEATSAMSSPLQAADLVDDSGNLDFPAPHFGVRLRPRAQRTWRSIALYNYKGGVGKTTIALNLGHALAARHAKSVLLVDVDPQANLSLLTLDVDKARSLQRSPRILTKLLQARYDTVNPRTETLEACAHASKWDFSNTSIVPNVASQRSVEAHLGIGWPICRSLDMASTQRPIDPGGVVRS